MDDLFTPHFATYHICLRISQRFKTGSYADRIAHTLLPDRFRLPTGPVPSGEVAVWVPGHNAGAKRENLSIPVEYLSSAAPKSKKQQCLVTRGSLKGDIYSFQSVAVRKQVATLTDGTVIPFSDITLVELPM